MRTRADVAPAVLFLALIACGLAVTLALGGDRVTAQGSVSRSAILASATDLVTLDVSSMGACGLQLSGTFVGTVQFEGTINGGTYVALNMVPSNSATAATSATAVGAWSANCGGYAILRARMSAWTSGAATATLRGAASGGK